MNAKLSQRRARSQSQNDWSQWIDGLHEALAEAKASLSNGTSTQEELNALMRSFHLIKGFAQALGLHGVQSVAHEIETRIFAVSSGDPRLRAVILAGVSKLDATLARLHEIDLHAAAIREIAVRAPRFSDLFSRIESAARGISLDLGQKLNFDSRGGDEMALEPEWEAPFEAALLHAIRNSLDHGSSPETRLATSPLKVTLSVERQGNELVIECCDSGTGIDPMRVREVARERQARFDAEMGGMSDAEVLQLLFLPGLSLSRGVSKLSGRGYGLDIVRAAIETKLGGHVRIESQPGVGTRLILRVPIRS